MSFIHVVLDGDYEIWLSQSSRHRDVEEGAFVIGAGTTERAAVDDALADLAHVRRQLWERLALMKAAKKRTPIR